MRSCRLLYVGFAPLLQSSLAGKTVGIYFSASWCPPCQSFTPKLMDTVRKLKDRGEQLEVVFVSNDRDEESFKKYFDKMDWLAVPFKDAASRAIAQVRIPHVVQMHASCMHGDSSACAFVLLCMHIWMHA